LVGFLGAGMMGCTPQPGPGILGDGCLETGGQMVTGMAGPTCATPTPDAGKSCLKASDCSGSCLGATMTCATVTPNFGCYEVMMENGQGAVLCVD
jgi:hypothetical protein